LEITEYLRVPFDTQIMKPDLKATIF